MSAHTPGPWSVHEHMGGDHETDCSADGFVAHTVYIGAGGVLLGEFGAYRFADPERRDGFERIDDFEVNRANARLAIAAPDLLQELREILEWAIKERAPLRAQEIASIRAAIAKATGAA